MHRLLSAVIVLIFSAMLPVYGQREKNIVYKIGVGELIYTPANGGNADSPGKVLKSVAETLLTGQTSSQQPQYAEAVRASIVNGLSKVRLFARLTEILLMMSFQEPSRHYMPTAQ